MLKFFLNCLFILLLFSSCFNNNDDEIEIIYINPLDAELTEMVDVFSVITPIALETRDSILIGGIDDILFCDERFVILDKKFKSVYIYDTNGNFIALINNSGRGSDEYLSVSCIYIDENKNIVLVDNSLHKEFVYSPTGEYIKSDTIPYSIKSVDILQDGTKIVNKDRVDSRTPNGYLLNIRKRAGVEEGYFPYSYSNGSVVYEKNRCVTISGSDLFYSTLESDTIWKYNYEGFVPEYVIDFMGYGIPKKLYKTDKRHFGEELYRYLIHNSINTAYWPYIVKMNNGALEFCYLFKNRLCYCLYDVRNEVAFQFSGPTIAGKDIRRLSSSQFCLNGMYCFVLDNYKISLLNDNERMAISESYPQLYDLILKNKIDNNPIIILSTIKYE